MDSIKKAANEFYSKSDCDDFEVIDAFMAGVEWAKGQNNNRSWLIQGSMLQMTGDRGWYAPTMNIISGPQLFGFGEQQGEYRYTEKLRVYE